MTTEDLMTLPVTMDLVTAARAFGIGRSGAYDLARRGELPFRAIKVGKRYRVMRAELLRALGMTEESAALGA